ncbi:hypothetical protein PilKf_00004 [Pillotina sp. SPG140]|jgi:hypothetical protein
MSSESWQERVYQETFEQEVRGLERRRTRGCLKSDLEQVLQSLYILDGADWIGRGAVQDCTITATIAAHEYVLATWHGQKET